MLAKKLEPLVLQNLKHIIQEHGSKIVEKAKLIHERSSAKEASKQLRQKIYGLNSQLDAMAERLAQLPKEVSAAPIFKQMEMLERKREIYKRELEYAAQFDETIWGMPVEFKTFRKFSDSLEPLLNRATPELLSKIASKLIHKVEIGPESVKVHYFGNQSHYEALKLQEAIGEMKREARKERENQKNADPGGVGAPSGAFGKNLMCIGSNSLTNGARERT